MTAVSNEPSTAKRHSSAQAMALIIDNVLFYSSFSGIVLEPASHPHAIMLVDNKHKKAVSVPVK